MDNQEKLATATACTIKIRLHLPSLKTVIKRFLKGHYSITIFLALVHVVHFIDLAPSYLLTLYF